MLVVYPRALLIGVLLLLAGCAGPGRGFYEPNPDTVPLGPIIEFFANKDIDLINGQVSAENVLVVPRGPYPRGPYGDKLVANPRAWTDTVITILQKELNDRLTRVVKGADKKLILSVESVSAGKWYARGYEPWQCVVYLKVETGDGYIKTFIGDVRSRNVFRAADAALIRAVAEVLKDYDIWKYRKE